MGKGKPFEKGHAGGPGRPARVVEERDAKALREAWPIEDEIAAWKMANELAKAGSLEHLKFLDERLHGKLVERKDIGIGRINLDLQLNPGDDSAEPPNDEDSPLEISEQAATEILDE